MDDDWNYFPQQFGIGSTHDLSGEPYQAPRLEGMKSVKNTAGGIVRVAPTSRPKQAVGFAIPLVGSRHAE